MKFHEKLQDLRKQKGLTQEELAESLYVSRTAVSKWESGRGYPNIESLKDIAKLFGVSIDELLTGEEALTIAEEDNQEKRNRIRDLIFGFVDVSGLLLLFLPLFGQTVADGVQSVSLLSFTKVSIYLKIAYFDFISSMFLTGVLTLILRNCRKPFWMQAKGKLSLLLNVLGVLLFVLSRQPYPAIFLFVFLMIKVLILIKNQ